MVHPNDARDLRVIELVYRLGQGSARDLRELMERQFLEKRFCTLLAEATDNRFYMLETSWWFKLAEDRGARPPVFSDEQRQQFYREIARRLVDDRDAARFYLDSLSPLLDMLGAFALMGMTNAR